MPHHIIHAILSPSNVVSINNVAENPLEVQPEDTVEWNFQSDGGQLIQNAQIEFRGFLPESRTASIMGPPKSPFTSLQTTQLKAGPFTVADEDRGIYFYVILLDGRVLEWATPLFTAGSFSSFFGGIIIRDPGGSGTPSTDQ